MLPLAALLLASAMLHAAGQGKGQSIFWLNEAYEPNVNLKPLEPLTPQVKAVLALYALRAGTGCPVGEWEGKTYIMSCTLTSALGLGRQCSPDHLDIVRRWFKDGIPPLNLSPGGLAHAKAGKLDMICENVPDTATHRTILEVLRTERAGDILTVHAVITSSGGTSWKYDTTYRLAPDRVTVVEHKETPKNP
jgi:hypothetical protein